jgi:hypothetical protein
VDPDPVGSGTFALADPDPELLPDPVLEIKGNEKSSYRHSIKLYILFPSFKCFSLIELKMKLYFFLKKTCSIWFGSGAFPRSDPALEKIVPDPQHCRHLRDPIF